MIRHLGINIHETKVSADLKVPDEIIEDKKVSEAKAIKVPEKDLVGKGSWNTKTIKDAGLELPSKYFIGVYTDYYRFNPDSIKKDFPNKSIQTLQDLKQAIEAKKTAESKNTVGTGSWSTEEIQNAGIDLQKYGKYFIGVYTNFYRFNPDTIKRDFGDKSIQNLDNLKEAINDLESKDAVVRTKTTHKDGSYKIEEYDHNGQLVKIEKYDSDGKITYEYSINNDGSNSSKYYTYENGKLIQLQETILYSDGNCTYIYTDGEGNIKEIQKVIQNNEYGGITFDTTFADGTRHVHNHDANNNVINALFYSVDGNLEKSEEYKYDENNPNLFTKTIKNAEGKVTTEEVWETFKIENGGGCRLKKRIEYDENGNITNVFEYDSNGTLGTDTPFNVVMTANGRINNIYIADADGNVLVNVNLDDPNLESVLSTIQPPELAKVIREYAEINKVKEQVDALRNVGDNDAADKLQAELDKQKEVLGKLLAGILDNIAKEKELNSIELEPPLPPSKSDYIDANGYFDEAAYNNAIKQYDDAKAAYENKQNEINAQLQKLRLNKNRMQLELNRTDSSITNVGNQAQTLADLKEQINSAKDPDVKLMLEGSYTKLKVILIEKNSISDQLDSIYLQIEKMEIPTPPNKSDYTDKDGKFNEEAYNKAMVDYNNAKNEYDVKLDSLNRQVHELVRKDRTLDIKQQRLLALVNNISIYGQALEKLKSYIESALDQKVKATLQKEYDNLKELLKEEISVSSTVNDIYAQIESLGIPVPPNIMDFTTVDSNGNNIIDDFAYNKAVQNYDKAKEEYKKQIEELQAKADSYIHVIGRINLQKESNNNTVSLILEFAGALNRLQGEIDATNDPEVKAKLQAKYEHIQELMKQAIEVSKAADEKRIESYITENPQPPSIMDYTETDKNGNTIIDEFAYDNAMAQYEKDMEVYQQQVSILLEKADSYDVQLARILDEAGIVFIKGNNIVLTAERQKLEESASKINSEIVSITNKMSEIQEELITLQMPTPPNRNDFMMTDENGNKVLDYEAYEIAMKKYEEEKNDYEKKVAELNKKLQTYQLLYNKLNLELNTIDVERAQLMQYQDLLNIVSEKISTNLSPDAIAELKDIYSQLNNLITQSTEQGKEVNKVRHEMFNTQIPTPPIKSDYTTQNENGNTVIDEQAYENAMAQYDIDKAVYDSTMQILNEQMRSLQEKGSQIYQDIQNLKELADKY